MSIASEFAKLNKAAREHPMFRVKKEAYAWVTNDGQLASINIPAFIEWLQKTFLEEGP